MVFWKDERAVSFRIQYLFILLKVHFPEQNLHTDDSTLCTWNGAHKQVLFLPVTICHSLFIMSHVLEREQHCEWECKLPVTAEHLSLLPLQKAHSSQVTQTYSFLCSNGRNTALYVIINVLKLNSNWSITICMLLHASNKRISEARCGLVLVGVWSESVQTGMDVQQYSTWRCKATFRCFRVTTDAVEKQL